MATTRTARRTRRPAGPEAVRGAVAVIRRGGRYLMIRRPRDLVAGGAWCFPGGAIEPGESSGQAVVREVAEEVGLPSRAIEQVWEWTREDGELVLDWWRVEPLGDLIVPDPAEVSEFRWMSEPEIRSTPGVLPGLIQFLNHFGGGP
ncbi:MAG TPA: NUDIX hydrolase [Phycisphaerae bacterium]|nr:NUDIX hydrolase [Phycisphaerae bacterium]